jgi:hypothetical protein
MLRLRGLAVQPTAPADPKGVRAARFAEVVTKDQFEIEFARDDNPGLEKFHIHIRCFAAWEFERRQGGTEHT